MNDSSNAKNRILSLVDEGSFIEIGASVCARATDFDLDKKNAAGDGVITGYGTMDGKLVYIYSQDKAVLGGALGEMHAKKILRMYDMAMKMGAPVIGLIDSCGMRLEESVDALEGFGLLYEAQAKASGMVPEIQVIYGQCGGALALSAGLADFVYMVDGSALFVNAPNTLEGNSKEKCDTASGKFMSENSGIVDFAGTEEDVVAQVRELVAMLPANNIETAVKDTDDDLNRLTADLEGVTDIRSIASVIADNFKFVETKKEYGKSFVTGLLTLDGVTVGIVGNQEEYLEADGLKKAASFVNFCDAFDLPIVSFTNALGFEASIANEKNVAKAASELLYAFANATVPKINVILKKAYASAYIMMNSKASGADFVYAVEDAKIGIMDANMAAKIIGGDLEETAKAFDEKQTVEASLKRGYVDAEIQMTSLRKNVLVALEMLFNKRVDEPFKKHGTK